MWSLRLRSLMNPLGHMVHIWGNGSLLGIFWEGLFPVSERKCIYRFPGRENLVRCGLGWLADADSCFCCDRVFEIVLVEELLPSGMDIFSGKSSESESESPPLSELRWGDSSPTSSSSFIWVAEPPSIRLLAATGETSEDTAFNTSPMHSIGGFLKVDVSVSSTLTGLPLVDSAECESGGDGSLSIPVSFGSQALWLGDSTMSGFSTSVLLELPGSGAYSSQIREDLFTRGERGLGDRRSLLSSRFVVGVIYSFVGRVDSDFIRS